MSSSTAPRSASTVSRSTRPAGSQGCVPRWPHGTADGYVQPYGSGGHRPRALQAVLPGGARLPVLAPDHATGRSDRQAELSLAAFGRLGDGAPLYCNGKPDFYALSRFGDVERGLRDPQTYISGRGGILELIKANIEMPPGVLIFEDPPLHTVHRGLLSRVFTPRKMNALEPKVREFCARCLDPVVDADGFDFVADLGAQMPMWVIGMLLGIPEEGQEEVRDRVDSDLRTKPGEPMRYSETSSFATGDVFADYIDWRVAHPSDDLMTELLNAEFEDETGTTRRLTRDEILTYVNVVAGAGHETTTRLIGWTGKLLADHPDQRRQLVQDRSLIPNAIEQILRYEPPAPPTARYVARRLALYGRTV